MSLQLNATLLGYETKGIDTNMDIKLDFKGKRYEGGKTLDALLDAYVAHERENAADGEPKPSRNEVIAELCEAGLRRRAAVAREQARKKGETSWAGMSDVNAPSPNKKGKGKHKAKGSKPSKPAKKAPKRKAKKSKKAEGVTVATNPGAA